MHTALTPAKHNGKPTRFTYHKWIKGGADLSGWLCTEMVDLSADSHTSENK